MDSLEVVDLEDGKDRDLHVSVKNAFRLHCQPTGESHLLCARKPEQKQRWLKALAREREQVRLDQETGMRLHLSWLSTLKSYLGTDRGQIQAISGHHSIAFPSLTKSSGFPPSTG